MSRIAGCVCVSCKPPVAPKSDAKGKSAGRYFTSCASEARCSGPQIAAGWNIGLLLAHRVVRRKQDERFLNLSQNQWELRQVIEPLLKGIDFDKRGIPALWWPAGKRMNVVVDPARAFGQPIDAVTSVPTAILAAAAVQDGVPTAARIYGVPKSSVRRAVEFESSLEPRAAA
jgi:hypothetical protein